MKRLVIAGILLLFGATLMAQTVVTGASVTKYEATSVESQPKLFVTPLAADLVVIQNASTSFKTQGSITLPEAPDSKDNKVLERYANEARRVVVEGIEELKAKALFEFSESESADVIVAPSFSVVTDKSDGRLLSLTIRVKGFPARYTNFRNVKPSDTTLVYINRSLPVGKEVKTITSAEASQLEVLEKK